MTAVVLQRLIVAAAFAVAPMGVLASKGMVIILIAGGLAGLALAAPAWLRGPKTVHPMAPALIALLLWAAVSATWSDEPSRALVLVARLAAVTLAGAGLVLAMARLDNGHRGAAGTALLAGMAVGLAALAAGVGYGKATGDSLWGTYFFDPLTTLNNGAVAVSLLCWPAFAVLWRRGRKTAACVAVVAVLGGLLFLSSGAALLAPVVGLAGFVVVWVFRRRGALALAAVAAFGVVAMPAVVSSPPARDLAATTARVLPPSAQHRLQIWAFTVEKIDQKPLWGWGMDASRRIPQTDRRLATNMEIMPLHPHNAFLQLRLELGIIGAAIGAALAGLYFGAIVGRRDDRFAAAVMAGAGGAYLTVAGLSYGAWQNWWVALAWVLAALTGLAAQRPRST